MPAAAIAIPAAIKAGTSIAGGLQSRSAVNDSVSALLNAFGQAGTTATDAVNKVNPQILDTASTWGANVMGAGESAATGATDAANTGIESINRAVAGAQAGLSPYTAAGAGSLETLTKLLQNPQQFQFQADPGYQFRLSEGQKQIQRMAAAHGAAGGGGTAKALSQYNSGLASQEYGNAWNRWNEQNKTRLAGLSSVAGLGERAGEFSGDIGLRGATTGAGLGERAAEYAGTMRTGTTQWAGSNNINAVDKTSQNTLDLANFLANLQISSGKTIAGGDMARAGIWNQTIGSLGDVGLDIFKGLDKKYGWSTRKSGDQEI